MASPDGSAALSPKITCLPCGTDLSYEFARVNEHPRLGVALCCECLEAVEDVEEEGALDEDGSEEWCCLCGSDAGLLLCCEAEDCCKAFCTGCTGLLLCGPEGDREAAVKAAEAADNWACPACTECPVLQAACENLATWALVAGNSPAEPMEDDGDPAEGPGEVTPSPHLPRPPSLPLLIPGLCTSGLCPTPSHPHPLLVSLPRPLYVIAGFFGAPLPLALTSARCSGACLD